MAFEIDHVGVVVDVITSREKWSADATLFAVGADGSRIAMPRATIGRDPEMHRPPRLSRGPLIELLAEHGKVVSEKELIAMPFRFEFSAGALAALEER